MNHLTSTCFLTADPVYRKTKKGGYATVLVRLAYPMILKNGKLDPMARAPILRVYARETNGSCAELLKAKKGDFATMFGELYASAYLDIRGGSGVMLILDTYRVAIMKKSKIVSEVTEDGKKSLTEMMNEIAMSDDRLEEDIESLEIE